MSLTNTQYAAVMRMYDDIHTHNAAIQRSNKSLSTISDNRR